MNIGPTSKVLIALDLDYTHFNSSIVNNVCWLGDKQDWLDFYDSQLSFAHRHGVELYFMVITNKSHFDDHAEVAAKAFNRFLSLGNPHMYLQDQNERWCLVRNGEKLEYENLNRNAKKECNIDGAYSHFVVLPFVNKAPYILDLAQRYGISANQCLLLDDLQAQLDAARDKGIETVSFEEFCPENEGSEVILKNAMQIASILAQKRYLIAQKIKEIVLRDRPKQFAMTEHPQPQAHPDVYSIENLINDQGHHFCPMLCNDRARVASLMNCFDSLKIEEQHRLRNRHT